MQIIEGPDAVGKSTFINYLRKEGIMVSKPYYPKENQLRYYLHTSVLYGNQWLERYYPSEMIYPRVKKGREQMGNYKQFMIEAAVYPFSPVIIYLRPPLEIIKDNIKSRGDDYIKTDEEIEKMVWEYDKFMERTTVPVIKYNYLEDDKSEIIKEAKKIEYRGTRKNPWTQGIDPDKLFFPASLRSGNPYAKLMIIGEEPSNSAVGQGFIRPFINDSGSSLFFHECLYEAGIYKKYGMPYFTNFYKFSSHEIESSNRNKEILIHEIASINPFKIIILGDKLIDIFNEISGDPLYPLSLSSGNIITMDHPKSSQSNIYKKDYIYNLIDSIK